MLTHQLLGGIWINVNMAEQLLFTAAANFESARKVSILPEGTAQDNSMDIVFLQKCVVPCPKDGRVFPVEKLKN